jgi:ATP-dependent RNA helicase DDX20
MELSDSEQIIKRTADIKVSDEFTFSNMLLSDKLLKSLSNLNFVKPSPIQLKVIPLARSRIDMIMQAKSGTGKTLAFSICLLENYDSELRFPQGLVIVPTREIAVQIVSVLNDLGKNFKHFKACEFIGGMEITNDRKKIQNSKIVVGTPGRILHLIKSEIFNTSCVKTLVLDEADKLFEGGQMEQDMKKIVNFMNSRIQYIATTATVSSHLETFAKQQMKNPIGVTPKHEIPVLLGIKQFVNVLTRCDDNIECMNIKINELVKIFNRITFKQCLLFTSSQSKTESYGNYLRKQGWKNEVINGAQDQSQRLNVLEKLTKFKCRILITTDLMARGIDIENINLIINLDLPYDGFTYLHRIGRAGRFGTHGIAITLLNGEIELDKFHKILHDFGGDETKVLTYPKEDEKYDFWNFDESQEIGEKSMETLDENSEKHQNIMNNLTLLDITKRLVDEPKYEEKVFNLDDILGDYDKATKDEEMDDKSDKSKDHVNSSDSGVEDIFMKTINELNLYENENKKTSRPHEKVENKDENYRKVIFRNTALEEDDISMTSSDTESDEESEDLESESEDEEEEEMDETQPEAGHWQNYSTLNQSSYQDYNYYVADHYNRWQNIYNFQLASIQNYIYNNRK